MLPSLERRLAQIRSALTELTEIQSQLQTNATDAKSAIQSSFRRQLEALRAREVHLLGQVETLQQVKQDHVQRQADALHRELGALEALLLQHQASSKALQKDVDFIMKRFQQLDVSHEEDASLSFEGDAKKLKKAIVSFGHVQAKRPRLEKDEDQPSTSKEITGSFQQFADRQVWLLKTRSGDEETRAQMVYPIFLEKRDSSSWLKKGDSASGSSPHSLASGSDGEGEGDDDGDDEDAAMEGQEDSGRCNDIADYFAHILTSPSIKWIRPADSRPSAGAAVGVSPHQQRKPVQFYRPAGDTKDWLRGQSGPDRAQETMETSSPNFCSPNQGPVKQVEIEDLADLVCVQDSPSGAASPCSPKASSTPKTQQKEDKATPCCSTSAGGQSRVKASDGPSIADVCKGNEKCNTFDECLCEENCADAHKQSQSSTAFSGIPESSKNQWLVKTPSVVPPSDEAAQEWLAPKTTPAAASFMNTTLSDFTKWQQQEDVSWVKKPSSIHQGRQHQGTSDPQSTTSWLVGKSEPSDADNRMIVGDATSKGSSGDEKQHSEWLVPSSTSVGSLPSPGKSSDLDSWLVKRDPSPRGGESKGDPLQEKWLLKQSDEMQDLSSRPPAFSYFTAPVIENQWLKQ